MRRRTGLLMDGDEPAGGKWNYDAENRDVPERGHRFPEIPKFAPDATTRKVMREVETRFPDHFGELDGFAWPVTSGDAERFFDDFVERRLDRFGPYEDALVAGEGALYHSLVSPLLNLGLLDPLDLCRRAEARYREGKARINSVEGFIRQILGWRELVHQVYRWKMPGYTELNALRAEAALPGFYWTGETSMRCVADAIQKLRRNGINHHIERLMITGNFALIAGIRPQEVNEWYWLAYADAFEWVVSPNVLGLSLFADGGVLATKPYAASANYIHKMSDYCGGCEYDHESAQDETSCPFNSLYWDFLARNRRRFQKNPRMNLVMAALGRKKPKELAATRARARALRSRLRRGGEI
jgi:deoxyribodipyrimidine photolyase-related protein